MRIVRSVATIGGFSMINRVLGFLGGSFFFFFFGAGAVADAFFLGF